MQTFVASLFLRFRPCLLGLALLAAAPAALAQTTPGVGIGTTAPDVSAALDIVSSSKGALLPRVADATALATPATGLLVFQTNAPAGFYYNAGTPAAPSWQQLNVVGGAGDNLGNHTATQALNLQGNALTGTGASIGSVVGLGVRADGGLNIGQNTAGNNFFLGYQSGGTTTGIRNTFVGFQSGPTNTTGNNNTFTGFASGQANTAGTDNTFAGGFSGSANIGGSNNTFNGRRSGQANTSGNNNTFVGHSAGNVNLDGSQNTLIGQGANVATGSLTNATALGAGATVSQSNSLVLGNGANVGIGTPAPSALLDVNGSTRLRGLTTAGVVTTDALGNLGSATAASLDPTTASNGLTKTGPDIKLGGTLTAATTLATAGFGLSITGAGNVGIGANSNGSYKLTVGGSTQTNLANGTFRTFNNGAAGGTVLLGGFDGTGGLGAQLRYSGALAAGTFIDLGQDAGGNFVVETNDVPRLTVLGRDNATGEGNVGIGTTAPTAALDVNGSTRLRGLTTAGVVTTDANGNLTSSTSLPAGVTGDNLGNHSATQNIGLNDFDLRLRAATDAVHGLGYYGTVGASKLWNGLNVDGPVLYGYAGGVLGTYYGGQQTVLAWKASGQVGIGTNSPSGQLANNSVNTFGSNNQGGNSGSLNWATNQGGYVAQFFNGGNTAGGSGVAVKIDGTDANATALDVSKGTVANAAGTSLLVVKAGGNVGIGAGTPSATLHVGGAASTVKLEGLGGGTSTRTVTVATDGTLGTTASPSGTDFIQNTTTPQASSNFNISGNGTVGGTLTAANAVVTTALTGTGASLPAGVLGLGVRADGGLNIGQNTTGANLYLGYQAGQSNTTGTRNQFEGYQSGQLNSTGSFNGFSGYQSGFSNAGGSNNVYSGWKAGFSATGSQNVFVGSNSGFSFTTGSSNTALGFNTGPASGSEGISNATALGANVTLTTSNTVVLGNGANVGIGTAAPAAKLYVQAADNATAPIASFQPLNLSQGVSIGYNGIAKTGTNATSDLTLDGKSTGHILLHTNGSTGNVGIGTTAAPAAKLEVVGDVRIPAANSYTYASARAKSVMLGGLDFQAENGTTATTLDGSTDELYPSGAVGVGLFTFRAPLHLPQNATITGIALLTYDGSTYDLTANLISYQATAGFTARTTLATAASTGTAGYQTVNSGTIATIVDNDNFAYSVRLTFSGRDTNLLTVRGVKVSYTIARVE